MTRKQINTIVDRIAIRIAEANGFDLTGKPTSPGVLATNTMTGLALEALADKIVAAGISGNRVASPGPGAVPPTALRAIAAEADAAAANDGR